MTATDLEVLSLPQLAETLAAELDRREDVLERDLNDVRTFRSTLANVDSTTKTATPRLASVPRISLAVPETKSKKERVKKTTKNVRTPPTENDSAHVTASGRTYTNWRAINAAIFDGETDEYVVTQKTSSAATTKSNLARQFPDLDVALIDNSDGTTTITVRLGDPRPHAVAS